MTLPKPYYEEAGISIFCGDCREILPLLTPTTVITDPVWPYSSVALAGVDRPFELFAEMCDAMAASVVRLAVHLGCNSDPALLRPIQLRFFRVCWLEMVRPHYMDQLMYGSDVAYLYGAPPSRKPGQMVIPGRITDASSMGKEADHPCPRKLAHVAWLVKWWSDYEDVVVDPFMGSGTTLVAAQHQGRKAIGIEIEERYCEIAVNRLRQGVLFGGVA